MPASPLIRQQVEDDGAQACIEAFTASLSTAKRDETPYRHWDLAEVLPRDIAAELNALPFDAPSVGGVSGARELHNNTRRYLDADAIGKHPAARAVAEAFQSQAVVDLIEQVTGASLDGSCLRIEYAQDTDGFWLKPHTDLGVKKFTLLYYLGPSGHEDLGTDVYADADTWARRAPFVPGGALVFVPSNNTWHGFEPRPIPVVRKSLIINYVTEDWRAREQLSYPDTPVRSRR